jgi:biotin-dependent carboxylase-like uncharacterized protein
MGALIIRSCGPVASVQDLGRTGYQRFGVSPAGAMDPLSLAIANLLVGNAADAAALELGSGVTRLVADGDLWVAFAGPDCRLEVEGRLAPPLASMRVGDGETITARQGAGGAYACLAVGGGIAVPPQMGSRSQHRRSAIGGPRLAPGSRIILAPEQQRPPPDSRALMLPGDPFADASPIRIIPGPQDDYFEPAMMEHLCRGAFRIGALRDRMGLRLEGPALRHRQGYNIISDGIVEGAIQVPGNGQPIVLLRDRQTTGGYPKIATIISADIGRFAQMPVGAAVTFATVTIEEAFAAARAMRDRIAALPALLKPLQPELTSERLLGLNLIDGVVKAEGPLA